MAAAHERPEPAKPGVPVPYSRLVESCPAELETTEDYLWWLRTQRMDLQVREPQLEEVGCCSLCRGTRWKPYPVTFEVVTMSDSPMLCSNYMVVRRWDEDFMKLAASIRDEFAFNTQLMSDMSTYEPRRLRKISEDDLTLQCGRHKRMLKWLLGHQTFYSSHDLHAFLGCKEDKCPSSRTNAVRKFPPYPPPTCC